MLVKVYSDAYLQMVTHTNTTKQCSFIYVKETEDCNEQKRILAMLHTWIKSMPILWMINWVARSRLQLVSRPCITRLPKRQVPSDQKLKVLTVGYLIHIALCFQKVGSHLSQMTGSGLKRKENEKTNTNLSLVDDISILWTVHSQNITGAATCVRGQCDSPKPRVSMLALKLLV